MSSSIHCGINFLRQIQSKMQQRGLSLVGWYHSHPDCEPRPTYQDVVLQKKYQNIVKEVETDEPCIGFIVSEWGLHHWVVGGGQESIYIHTYIHTYICLYLHLFRLQGETCFKFLPPIKLLLGKGT